MPIAFSDEDKKTITRRQVNIATENEAFTKSEDSFNEQKQKLQKVDNSNNIFYTFYSTQVNKYESEARQMDGQVADTYTNTDVTAAAQTPTSHFFFPTSPTPAYLYNIPLIQSGPFTNNRVRGRFHPTSTDSRRELNILNNTVVSEGLQQMEFRLSNGITGGTPALITTTGTLPAGPTTGTVLPAATTTGLAVGELVYAYAGAASGLYQVTAIVPSVSVTVASVIPSALGISSPTLDNTVAAFTTTERENLTSSLFQELLTTITNTINSLVTEWEGKIDAQITALTGHEEERTLFKNQNSTALLDVQNAKAIIDTWQALPNTGVGAKYTPTGMAPLMAEVSARLAFIPTRITQIEAALGTSSGASLSQTGNEFTATDQTNRYYLRYKWLNFRINRATGSLRRYYAAEQSSGALSELKNSNTALSGEYDQYFLTRQITAVDDTPILQLKSNTGLLAGDQVFIVSETQPIIKRVIIQIMGTNQVKLDSPIPNTYQVGDLARLYKEL